MYNKGEPCLFFVAMVQKGTIWEELFILDF